MPSRPHAEITCLNRFGRYADPLVARLCLQSHSAALDRDDESARSTRRVTRIDKIDASQAEHPGLAAEPGRDTRAEIRLGRLTIELECHAPSLRACRDVNGGSSKTTKCDDGVRRGS